VSGQHERDRALKRGGGHHKLSIDLELAEGKYALEPVSDLSPERIFEKSWALSILEQTMAQLEAEFKSTGKQELFNRLKVYLGGDGESVPYRDVAVDLDMTEDAIKAAVYRLRRDYRRFLRNEIAQTVTSDEQIDEEIRDLFVAVSGSPP
jgi:RNA polymerase sigma-70 factor (ECF subfamily)